MLQSRMSGVLLASVAALAPVSPNLHAAEWAAEPSIGLRAEYNDNPRLTSTPSDSVWAAVLDPRVRLSRRTHLWDIIANGRIRDSRHHGQEGLDTTDNFLDAALKRRFERGSMDLSASQANDTTLQYEELDLDTGLTVDQVDRTRRSFQLGGQYMFTETTWLQGSFNYSTVEYDNGQPRGLFDYDTFSPSLQLVRQLDPKTRVFGVYSHTKTDYDRIDNLESTTDSLMLGAAYAFTETLSVNGSIGAQRTTTSFLGLVSLFPPALGTVETDASGLVYNLDLSRRFETGNLTLGASRSISPSSTGTSSETTSVTLRGSHSFSVKLSGALAVSFLQSERIGARVTTSDRDRYRISPSLSWRLDEDLALNAGYVYTRISRSGTSNDTADSNVVYVGIGYTWPRMSVSR